MGGIRKSEQMQSQKWAHLPDLTMFDIKIISNLDTIAARKFLHHRVVVFGVVACDMTNLVSEHM